MSFVERIKLTDGTEVASVDANNRLEVAEPNTAAIKTAVEIIDNAISGNEMQVDVVAALPAGTNNIGDVDVLTVPAPLSTSGNGTAATALRVTVASDSTGTIAATQSGTWNVNNVSGTVSLPTGAATSANQSTIITAVQLLDDVVATDGSAALTKLYQVGGTDGTNAQILSTNASGHLNIADGGNSITVDGTVAATQSGTWNIGSITTLPSIPAGTNNIGDVDVLTLPSLPTGSNTIGAVNQAGTWNITNVSGTVSLPTGASTSANQSTIITALQLLDDAVLTDNAGFTDGATKLNMAGYIFDEVAGTALTENDAAAARIDSKRAQIGIIEDATTRGRYATVTAANALKVDGSAVTQPVSGTFWQATQPVSIAAAVAVTDNNSSLTVDGTVSITANSSVNLSQVGGTSTVTGGVNGSLGVGGNVAHDGVDAGNPQKIGAKAIAHGTNPTAVAAADRTDLYANRHGILWTIGGHPNTIARTTYISDATGAQTGASIVGTIAAGTRVVVTSVTVTVDSAVTATGGVAVKIGFSTTTTLPADSATGANGVILDHKGIAAGSGVNIGNGGGIIGIGADDEELRLTCEDPVGGGLSVTVTYYTIES